jgi:thiaminase/transcriptional activator TenA
VQEFIRFAGLVIGKAPNDEGTLLLLDGSFAVLGDELRWFHSTLTQRGVATETVALQPTNERYCAAMQRWGRDLDWGMAVLAYYAVESSYNAAWSSCATAPEPYRSWALRWGSPEFSAFCDGLEAAAEAALTDPTTGVIPPAKMEAAVELFREVLLLEEEFWSMAYEGSS